MSMTNALIITPNTFKQQLVWKLCGLLEKQKEKRFEFPEPIFIPNINDVIDPIEIHVIHSENGKNLIIEVWNDGQEELDDISSDLFYIEQLWSIYLACEPIYQQRFNDYSTLSDA